MPTAARLPPGAVLALERHGSRGRRTACQHGRSRDRARWETRGRGRCRHHGLSRGASAARPLRRRHCRDARRPRSVSLQIRHRQWLCRGRQRRLRQSRPRVASPLLGAVKVGGLCSCRSSRLGLCLARRAPRFQRRHQRGRPPRRPCRGRATAGGQGRFARGGAAQHRARPSQRAAPPRPTQGHQGSRSPQRGWRRGSRPRTRLAAGRRGSEGAELQARPRKVAPRKAKGRRLRLHPHSTMKAMTWAMAGHLRRCRRGGGRLNFFQWPQTAESVWARP